MIKSLQSTDLDTFDLSTLARFEPYFGLDYNTACEQQRQLWFENLLSLAKHNLSIAHCVHHNHYAKSVIQAAMHDGKIHLDRMAYTQSIGCLSNAKSADSMQLNGRTLSGTKHWISLLDIADYAVLHIPAPTANNPNLEALIVLDLATVPHNIDYDFMTPIGMEMARPASLTVEDFDLPQDHILGYREYGTSKQVYFHLNNFANHCFITNYLGLIIGLHDEFRGYMENMGIDPGHECKKVGLEISSLLMIWHDNLPSINITHGSDQFWHRRNTQYTMSKKILLDLISLILQIGDSRWASLDPKNQRFRDALTFCAHMRPLHKNLQEMHFVNL